MKRLTKRVLAILLALTMVVSYVPQNTYAGEAQKDTTENIDDPAEETVSSEVYFVHSATHKIVTLNGVLGDPIDCRTTYNGESSVPENGLFTVCYGTGQKNKPVVNFTTKNGNTSWRARADHVEQMEKRAQGPGGHECVIYEPQGDGTVAFRSNATDTFPYVTVRKEVMEIVELKDNEKVSSDEKFILYTKTKPKAVKKVTASNHEGDKVTISWEGVKETLYCGYEVLYSKQEDGNYKSAGQTADTSMVVDNLDVDTTYYFKVRTVTNNVGGPYSDSKVLYAKTLKERKPKKTTGLDIKENSGKLTLTWDKADYATSYKVFRAESRFADYEEIATVTGTTFTDNNPNAQKYNNFYKVQGVNSESEGPVSEPTSLEMKIFGSSTYLFSPKDDVTEINKIAAEIFEKQHYNQFGKERYLLAFKPGNYTKAESIDIGYYTQVLGLGKTPYDVKLTNVKVPAALSNSNATCNFWVGMENLTIADTDNNGDVFFSFQWGASQAAPLRRMNVERVATFDWWYGWASGGFTADSYYHKAVGSYPQQQFYYRNCKMGQNVYGVNWNQVIQGCDGISKSKIGDNTGKSLYDGTDLINNNGYTNWNKRGCTTVINKTPEIREKPFIYFDTDKDEYRVFVPSMRENSTGITWSNNNMGAGFSLSVDKYFYVANPERDTAATINKALKSGLNILFQPGIYHVSEPIQVTRANTILLGLGMATIIPDNEEAAIKTADVGGIEIAGLILDAGKHSKTLLTVGEEGSNKNHAKNPTVLHDVIYRVGGTTELGQCDSCEVINSNNVIIDHTWIWRADHGDNVGWDVNKSKNGLIVNGDNVTAYGLFVEHFQEYDIIWRGENGKTFFLQNEKCYDPQNQADWMSHNGTKKGYASYKVTENVKNHYAVGLGVYDVFINTNGASIFLDNAIEVPNTSNVLIENACIVEIANGEGPTVGINHIINNTTYGITTGASTSGGYAIQRLLSYNNKNSISLPNYYEVDSDSEDLTPSDYKNEQGETPSKDSYAEKDIVKAPSSTDNETSLSDMNESKYDEKLSGKDPEPGKEDPTPAPTTAAPTTVAPTTVAPTTAAPTTVAPTAGPTTVNPTTAAPTTIAPTTQEPTTKNTFKYTYTAEDNTLLLPETDNLVRKSGVTAWASSEQTGQEATKAIDNLKDTRWQAKTQENEWLVVDLGKECTMNKFMLVWENAQAKDFDIEISSDDKTYTSVASITDATNVSKKRVDTIELESAVKARYIKVNAKKTCAWGFALFEVGIYGSDEVPTTAAPTTVAPTTEAPTTVAPTTSGQTNLEALRGFVAQLVDNDTAVRVMWETYEGATEYKLYVDGTFFKSVSNGDSIPVTEFAEGSRKLQLSAMTTNGESKLSDEVIVVIPQRGTTTTASEPATTDAPTTPSVDKPTTSSSGDGKVETTNKETKADTNVTTSKSTQTDVKIPKVKIKKATKKSSSKKLKVKLKALKGVNGYQVMISTSKKFKKAKTKKYKKAKFTIKKLKANKKYYIRVRAYKVVNGTTYYGTWTKRKVKLKK